VPPDSRRPPYLRGRSERDSGDPRVLSVSQLTAIIDRQLDSVGRVAVEGEVSGPRRPASGHLYFDLKDRGAQLRCIVWRSQLARAVPLELVGGERVVAHGTLDVYPPQGSYSLVVQRVEPAGVGELLVRFERLKAELASRGWFERARPLPAAPRVIGVATSRDGAALQDFLRTRSRRWPLYPVRLCHTPVQGAGAAEEIARAIDRLDQSGVDAIAVIRGGGSIQDLWAFNELPVAEAIWRSRAPVVTGVGHETDSTLADFVADCRAHTPTDAAQRIIPDRAALAARLEELGRWLARAIDRQVERRIEALAELAASRVLVDPGRLLGDRLDRLERARERLGLSARHTLERAGGALARAGRRLAEHRPDLRLERLARRLDRARGRLLSAVDRRLAAAERREALCAARLEACSPLAVLARGYTVTTRAGCVAPLLDAADLAPGEEIETRLASGRLRSRVERTLPAAPSG